MTTLKITVVICTYNRADKLARLLNCLANQVIAAPSSININYLIVNNNSSDATESVVKQYMNQLPLRLVLEQKQGLSNARNRAINETDSDWLIFIDDDILPVKDIWQAYAGLIKAEKVDFIGGRILLNWLKPRPKWLVNEDMALIAGVLGKFDLGIKTIPFEAKNESPRGANFAVSRQVLNDIGGFDTRYGVNGDRPGRGEETEYFKRVRNKGYIGFYCGAALCQHDALVERLTTTYMLSHGFEKGRAEYALGSQIESSYKDEALLLLRAVFQLIKCRKDRYLQTILNIGLLRGFRHQASKAIVNNHG